MQVVQGQSARRKLVEIECGSGADPHSIRQTLLGRPG
jgi:hypothetical protein